MLAEKEPAEKHSDDWVDVVVDADHGNGQAVERKNVRAIAHDGAEHHQVSNRSNAARTPVRWPIVARRRSPPDAPWCDGGAAGWNRAPIRRSRAAAAGTRAAAVRRNLRASLREQPTERILPAQRTSRRWWAHAIVRRRE